MKRARIPGPGAEPVFATSADGETWRVGDREVAMPNGEWMPPVDGSVVGAILNDMRSLEELGSALNEAPYLAPPVAPVLFIKPRSTLCGHRGVVAIPAGASEIEVGASLAIVFSRTAKRLTERDALDAVAGYTVVLDLSLPQDSLHRPAFREKCFDGACPIGPWIVDAAAVHAPETLEIVTRINGTAMAWRSLGDLVRPVPNLISAVTAFMTFQPGDVLLTGIAHVLPRAKAGDQVEAEIAGVGPRRPSRPHRPPAGRDFHAFRV